ncbi:MAG TPA: hypothetical protein VKR06_13325 [Ktedonosporobacter sp.]|nr:hypothetical protein [Ktedonosporobacter sp.]
MITSSQGRHSISRVFVLGCLFVMSALSSMQTFAARAQIQPPALVGRAASTTIGGQALNIVQQYQGVWTSPPTNLMSGETADGPLMGNGDVGVVVGGTINNMTFYLGKNDFWSANSHAIKPLGRILLAVPGLGGSSYNMVEDLLHAEVRGTFSLNGATLHTTSWVAATDNIFVTQLALTGGGSQRATITLQDGFGNTPTTSITNDVLSADVQADTVGSNNPLARVASRVIGTTTSLSNNHINLTLQPGATYTLVSAIISNIDSSTYQSTAISKVSGLAQSDVNNLNGAHRGWWQTYWSQSFVQIPDKAIEKSWYGSLYLLGSASQPGKYAPGLWGNWITRNMNWNGDYHTNYDYESPFYAAFTTNHVDQTVPYDQPVLDWIPRAQTLATQNGFTGVLYPVGLSPKGTSADTNLHNQKSYAAFLATDMIMHFYYTYDTAYANTIYNDLKQVGTFWQNYLSWDGSRYVINNDAPQEDNPYPQTNNNLSLGLVRFLFQGLVNISTALNVDASLRSTWQNILAHMSAFPTMTQNGQTVFRETEVGAGWVNDGNDILIQHIYPGSQIGLDSDANSLQIARNTVGQLTAAWNGGNAPATFYAAAARVGYNPGTILTNLHDEATNQSYNNLAIHHNGGGIENLNVVLSGIDEMLLQSFQNDVHVFADWPANTNAKFGNVLAYGAFQVSSDRESNTVQYLQAISGKGRNFTFTNPWPGQTLALYRNGNSAGTLSGGQITITTSPGETIDIAPNGTTYAQILTRMGLSQGFATGFESGDPQLSWSNTVDNGPQPAGGLQNVGGICCSLTGPEAALRNETVHTGSTALLYSGLAQGGGSHAYMKLYDFSSSPLSVGSATTLSYWIYPQSTATSQWVSGSNSTCVAIDLIFSDGTALRDSGSVDQHGNGIHPTSQCTHLTLDAWNQVTVNLGTKCNGKQIVRLDLGYDQPSGTGGYRGYVDDLSVSG